MGGPDKAFFQDAVVYAQSLALTGALTAAVKAATRRPRPRAYAGDPKALEDVHAYRSFFSGHTSLTFAALTTSAWTIRLRYGEQVWPWIVTGLVGASVGAERVLSGSHFPTDVLAGAIAGAAIGTAVPLLHDRSRGGAGDRAAATLVPTRYGFALSGRF
jgi:membrane-associated phospholipid phosphatase